MNGETKIRWKQKGNDDDDDENGKDEDHPANHILSVMAFPFIHSFPRDASRRQGERDDRKYRDTERETFRVVVVNDNIRGKKKEKTIPSL